MACGADHTVFVTVNSEVKACGKCEYGQLGIGYKTDFEHHTNLLVSFPKTADDTDKKVRIKQVSCGESHTHFLTDKG